MSNKTETNITLERIKELKGNDSQEVFAQKIHTTQSNISKMLKGMTPPSAATLTELAKTYHVSVDWLLGLSDEAITTLVDDIANAQLEGISTNLTLLSYKSLSFFAL